MQMQEIYLGERGAGWGSETQKSKCQERSLFMKGKASCALVKPRSMLGEGAKGCSIERNGLGHIPVKFHQPWFRDIPRFCNTTPIYFIQSSLCPQTRILIPATFCFGLGVGDIEWQRKDQGSLSYSTQVGGRHHKCMIGLIGSPANDFFVLNVIITAHGEQCAHEGGVSLRGALNCLRSPSWAMQRGSSASALWFSSLCSWPMCSVIALLSTFPSF